MTNATNQPVNIARLTDTFGEDMKILSELYTLYLEDTETALDDLLKALEAGDESAVERISHAIKGSSANIGAEAMRELTLGVEKTARLGDLTTATGLTKDARAEFETVKQFLLDYLDSAS